MKSPDAHSSPLPPSGSPASDTVACPSAGYATSRDDRRRFIAIASALIGLFHLSACGGGGDSAPPPGGGTTPPPPSGGGTTPPPPSGGGTPPPSGGSGGGIATLTQTSTGAGRSAYLAAVLPLRGQVPQGQVLGSADDASLRSCILSRWDDGSASVVVVAGTRDFLAGQSVTLALRAEAAPSEAALTAQDVARIVNSVVVDLGTPGRVSLSDFSNPAKVWWASSRTICARYRSPVIGSTAMEAVIDVHAFSSGQAFVEVVVENSRMVTASPVRPTAVSYTAGVLTVNGIGVTTVDSRTSPEGNHGPFRAWYGSAWVGTNVGARTTQAVAELQAHPLLFKVARTSTADLSIYAADTYAPFGPGRHRASGMGNGGDHPSIGPLTQWDARALQSGDSRAWRAAEVNALAVLGFAINYRDADTGLVPNFAQLAGKSMQTNWPSFQSNGAMGWEQAHHPATGLMAFLARPSPVFIELAQKVAVWNGTWSNFGPVTTGVFGGPYQARGRAWCMRSLGHAVFLTPDGDAWKAAGKGSLSVNLAYLDNWRTNANYVLGVMCDGGWEVPIDHQGSDPGFQQPIWCHQYYAVEMHKLASARLLTGADQITLERLADWACLQAARWVTEQPNGGWRYITYTTTIGGNSGNGPIGSQTTYGTERNREGNHPDTPTATGPWMTDGGSSGPYSAYRSESANGGYYPSYFWAALVAARERNVTGAVQAWTTVNQGITNLATWLDGAGTEPRWGTYPRNV